MVAFTVRRVGPLPGARSCQPQAHLPEPEQACTQGPLLVGALCLAGHCNLTYWCQWARYNPQMALREEPGWLSAKSSGCARQGHPTSGDSNYRQETANASIQAAKKGVHVGGPWCKPSLASAAGASRGWSPTKESAQPRQPPRPSTSPKPYRRNPGAVPSWLPQTETRGQTSPGLEKTAG